MFRETIGQTALTTSAADEFFGRRIYGDLMREDDSFVSTLRALLLNRVPEDGELKFVFQRSTKTASAYTGSSTGRVIMDVTGFYSDDDIPANMFFYHRFDNSDFSANDVALDYFESRFMSVFSGFQRVQRVTDFFVKRAKVLCFVNPELKTVFLFTGAINMRIYHYIQCGIYAMLPWYFATDDRPTDDEMEVIRSLRENDSSIYKAAISRVASKLNFREIIIRKSLAGFESATYRRELNNIAAQEEAIRNQIANLYQQARNKHQEKVNLEIKSIGLMAKIADCSENSAYMEYFLTNKNLTLVACNGTDVEFIVRGYLTFFDEENAKCVIDNSAGVLYRPDDRSLDHIIPTDDMKKLMKAVFLDKKIRIRMCAYYRLTRDGVTTRSGYGYPDEMLDCTPNPHIDRYACIGNYEEAINTLVDEGDYIGATEQCAASCQSLNFGDWAVMAEFANRLYGVSRSNMNCFELPDGKVTNPKGAIEWLKNEEAKETEAQEG